jgi:hypothetical protein
MRAATDFEFSLTVTDCGENVCADPCRLVRQVKRFDD